MRGSFLWEKETEKRYWGENYSKSRSKQREHKANKHNVKRKKKKMKENATHKGGKINGNDGGEASIVRF